MTEAQRTALIDMMDAILKCDCAPADVRFRAQNLLGALTGTDDVLAAIDRMFR